MHRERLAVALVLLGLASCSQDHTLVPTGAPRTEEALQGDLRDAPRCENAMVTKELAGRWAFVLETTNPGSGPGCFAFPTIRDTSDLCVGDTIFFYGDGECTMVGDASDFVMRVRTVISLADGCDLEMITVNKGIFNGDSYNASAMISETLEGTECGPYEDSFGCIGLLLAITGQRLGPPECAEPKRVVLHKRLSEAMAAEIRDQRESQVRPRDVKNVRQYR